MADILVFSAPTRPRNTVAARLLRWLEQRRLAQAERRAQREARAAFRTVALRDDRLLADMGLTREDVEWAALLPIDRNAALEARERARRRRGSSR